jgi:hypothetical protein
MEVLYLLDFSFMLAQLPWYYRTEMFFYVERLKCAEWMDLFQKIIKIKEV